MLGWEVIPRIPLGDLGSVSPHGVGIAVGYFIGATLMARRARKSGFDEDHAWNAAVVGILGAIVGARLAYVIGHNDQFNEPVEYLQIYKGGISLMGGLIGGFLAAWLYCRSKKLDFGRLADMGAAGLAIGTAVGRIGDLVIGDHLGRTTDGFWGWEYKGGELISAPPCDPSVYPSANGCIEPGMVVHQTALYDSLWALVIFVVILRLERRPRPKGFLIFTWAAMYSAGRILTDLTRVDKTWFGTGLTGSQLTAIAVLLLSLVCLARLRRKPRVAAVTPDDSAHAAAGAGAVQAPAAVNGPEAVQSEADLEPVEPIETVPAEPAPEVVEPAAGPVEVVEPAEPPVTAPTETVVVVEAVEEPPAAGEPDEPLVPVEPVSPVAPEAVEPEQAPPSETVDVAPEAGAEPVEVLFAEGEATPEPETVEETSVEREAGAEPVEVLFTEGEPAEDPVVEPEPAPAEPVEALRETVAAVDAAEAVVVEASASPEAAGQDAAGSLLTEEPVGAEAIDSMPLPQPTEPEFDSPHASDAEPSGVVVDADEAEVVEAGPEPVEEEPPPAGEPAEERQEP